MIEAQVDGLRLELQHHADHTLVNGEALQPSVERIGSDEWHVLLDGKSVKVTVLQADPEQQQVMLSVNGKRATVRLSSRLEQLMRRLGIEHNTQQKAADLKAPMPGLIRAVNVKPGDVVKKGDPLLILEAMKMENVVKASGDGVVAKVNVTPGQSVEKAHLLIAFS